MAKAIKCMLEAIVLLIVIIVVFIILWIIVVKPVKFSQVYAYMPCPNGTVILEEQRGDKVNYWVLTQGNSRQLAPGITPQAWCEAAR